MGFIRLILYISAHLPAKGSMRRCVLNFDFNTEQYQRGSFMKIQTFSLLAVLLLPTLSACSSTDAKDRQAYIEQCMYPNPAIKTAVESEKSCTCRYDSIREQYGKSTTQSYRTPVYYVDLILREGTSLHDAIQMAKDIDQQSKTSGFNQQALDQMARQGYGNARFEVNSEEVSDLVEEFYVEEIPDVEHSQPDLKTKAKPKFHQEEGFVQDIQQSLQQNVRAVN
jgi:hypothetical protein